MSADTSYRNDISFLLEMWQSNTLSLVCLCTDCKHEKSAVRQNQVGLLHTCHAAWRRVAQVWQGQPGCLGDVRIMSKEFSHNGFLFGCIQGIGIYLSARLVRNWLGGNCIPVFASYSQDMQGICSASSRLIQSAALKFECHSKVLVSGFRPRFDMI